MKFNKHIRTTKVFITFLLLSLISFSFCTQADPKDKTPDSPKNSLKNVGSLLLKFGKSNTENGSPRSSRSSVSTAASTPRSSIVPTLSKKPSFQIIQEEDKKEYVIGFQDCASPQEDFNYNRAKTLKEHSYHFTVFPHEIKSVCTKTCEVDCSSVHNVFIRGFKIPPGWTVFVGSHYNAVEFNKYWELMGVTPNDEAIKAQATGITLYEDTKCIEKFLTSKKYHSIIVVVRKTQKYKILRFLRKFYEEIQTYKKFSYEVIKMESINKECTNNIITLEEEASKLKNLQESRKEPDSKEIEEPKIIPAKPVVVPEKKSLFTNNEKNSSDKTAKTPKPKPSFLKGLTKTKNQSSQPKANVVKDRTRTYIICSLVKKVSLPALEFIPRQTKGSSAVTISKAKDSISNSEREVTKFINRILDLSEGLSEEDKIKIETSEYFRKPRPLENSDNFLLSKAAANTVVTSIIQNTNGKHILKEEFDIVNMSTTNSNYDICLKTNPYLSDSKRKDIEIQTLKLIKYSFPIIQSTVISTKIEDYKVKIKGFEESIKLGYNSLVDARNQDTKLANEDEEYMATKTDTINLPYRNGIIAKRYLVNKPDDIEIKEEKVKTVNHLGLLGVYLQNNILKIASEQTAMENQNINKEVLKYKEKFLTEEEIQEKNRERYLSTEIDKNKKCEQATSQSLKRILSGKSKIDTKVSKYRKELIELFVDSKSEVVAKIIEEINKYFNELMKDNYAILGSRSDSDRFSYNILLKSLKGEIDENYGEKQYDFLYEQFKKIEI